MSSGVGLMGGFVLCMLAGGGAGLILWPPRIWRTPTAAMRTGSGRDTAADAHGRSFADERDRLVRGCMDLADRLRDDRPTLYRKALRDLADVGVIPVVPDGHKVDENRDDVIGAKPTTDPVFDGAVASTERMGFTDRGVLVRRPQVIVWQGPEVLG